MAGEFSFDIVSKVDLQEVRNAVDQAEREVSTRFDFKDSSAEIVWTEKTGTFALTADNDTQLKSLVDVLQSKLHRRGIDIRSLDLGECEEAAKGTVRQSATLRQGIDSESARKIVKLIKDSGRKAQATIQGDQVRVSSKSKDDLQGVMALLRDTELTVPLQFINYR